MVILFCLLCLISSILYRLAGKCFRFVYWSVLVRIRELFLFYVFLSYLGVLELGYVRAGVWNIDCPEDVREVELLADTGAIYTVLPASFLRELGVEPIGRRRFRLANNEVIEREVGIVGIEVQGIRAHTIVVFGDEDVYLLGVVTLEELGLEVDSISGELRPLELLLM